MGVQNLAFVIQRAPYKQENTTLGYTHAIASQTAEIHLEDGDSVVATIILVGDGVLSCLKGQKAMENYGVTSLESHFMNALLVDNRCVVCKEDLERLGISEDRIADAEAMGADIAPEIMTWAGIQEEIEKADQLLFV
ncbi:DsrE family protein [Candidatus Moduliflexota bacterium]